MKAGLAAMTEAHGRVAALGRLPAGAALGLHGVTDEEMGSAGRAEAAQPRRRPTGWSSPSLRAAEVLAVGNGQLNLEVVFHGLAVHSSHPEDGRNAIPTRRRFIRLVEEESARLAAEDRSRGSGRRPSRSASSQAAAARSTVADRCQLTVDRRVLPSESLDDAEAELRAASDRLETERPGLSWEIERTVAFPPFAGTDAGELRRVLADAVSDLGGPAGRREPRGMRFATDASLYEAAGCAAVVFGPGEVSDRPPARRARRPRGA